MVINTCAVTSEAVRQARQNIRRIKREQPDAQIVVTGCAAQAEPATFAAMPEVESCTRQRRKARARRAWQSDERVAVGDIMAAKHLTAHAVDHIDGHTRAFVQVQNGCDHRCTFCIIPFGRGNSRSLPIDDVVAQARRLTGNGYREIVLTGVDITSYGADLAGAPKLGALGQATAQGRAGDRAACGCRRSIRSRPMTICSTRSPTKSRLMPHLHLSLQAGDDMILKRMKRRHSRADAIAFCDEVRALRPDVVFGADIIAGFPTETEDMFARSLDLVDECGLTQLHVFPFSPRPGTPAARMPQLDRAIIKERAQRLREKGEAALRAFLDAQIGTRRQVLTERGGIGRTEQFTAVRLNVPTAAGQIVDLTVAAHDGRQLIAA